MIKVLYFNKEDGTKHKFAFDNLDSLKKHIKDLTEEFKCNDEESKVLSKINDEGRQVFFEESFGDHHKWIVLKEELSSDDIHKELIELGMEAEDLMNWNRSTKKIDKRVKELKEIMYKNKIILNEDYFFIDENEIKWALEDIMHCLKI